MAFKRVSLYAYIQGVVPGMGTFSISGASLVAGQSSFTTFDAVSDAPLPASQTKFFNPMIINWRHSIDGGSSWRSDISSMAPVYVTLATPTLPIYHTTVHLAVHSDGATTSQSALEKTWAQFGDGNNPNNVKDWSGENCLSYYPSGVPFQGCALRSLDQLLATGAGRCGSFAILFQNVLAVNGIASTLIIAEPVNSAGELGMAIKEWGFYDSPRSFAGYPYPYKFESTETNSAGQIVPNGMVPYLSSYGDISNLYGASGQNTSTPSEKIFPDHAIVYVGSTYYDPSYGLTYTDTFDFAAKAVAGYWTIVDVDPAGVLRVKVNDGTSSVKFTSQP